MNRHLLHLDDQVTYCGMPVASLQMTTTPGMLTCTDCYDALQMERSLRHATVEDFLETS